MLIDHQGICDLIPHTGSMCLLDTVTAWDQGSIRCTAISHRQISNPFIDSAGYAMSSAILVEYGAQAAAVHAGLLQQGMAGNGTAYIGAVKNLKFHHKKVSRDIETLLVTAQCELNSREGAIYTIECGDDSDVIISARIVLVLPDKA